MYQIKINKFGGASIVDAFSVKRLVQIVKNLNDSNVIVLSAMGKTTNALETLLHKWFNGDSNFWNAYSDIKEYHRTVINDLFGNDCSCFDADFAELENLLKKPPSLDYNYEYDQIVSFGELFSTKIISKYIQQFIPSAKWVDIRKTLKTDHTFREASVDWELSSKLTDREFKFDTTQLIITQGFIGGTINNLTTTLGREGSDYTAAVLAWLLNAQSVTVWKDVSGIMNADPKWMKNAVPIEKLSYHEAVELSYYGAKVIHPKTIRPLQQKNIPLFVKSFLDPDNKGTLISNDQTRYEMPVYIRKENQILVTLIPQNFSFMAYDNIKSIHDILGNYRLRINLTQMSALSYSFCFDSKPEVWRQLYDDLSKLYRVKYNTSSELLTIRHHTPKIVNELMSKTVVYLEQLTRKTAQYVIAERR